MFLNYSFVRRNTKLQALSIAFQTYKIGQNFQQRSTARCLDSVRND